MTFNKEDTYDNQIAPLVSIIIKICKDNDIPMIASFCYKVDDEEVEDVCTTCIPTKDNWLPERFDECRKAIFKTQSIMAYTITQIERNK